MSAVTRGLVKGAAKVDGNLVGAVASGAFKGAVELSTNLGSVATVIAYAAAKAASAAASEVGVDAKQLVREALATQIDDLEDMVP